MTQRKDIEMQNSYEKMGTTRLKVFEGALKTHIKMYGKNPTKKKYASWCPSEYENRKNLRAEIKRMKEQKRETK